MHVKWDLNDWSKIIFTDECYIKCNTPDRLYVFRKPDEKFSIKYCVPKFLKFPFSVGIWSWLSYYGVSQLEFYDGALKGTQCKEILNKYINKIKQEHGNDFILQDDNVWVHQANNKMKLKC